MLVDVRYLSSFRDLAGKANESVEIEQETVGALLLRLGSIYGEAFNRFLLPDPEGEWHCLLMVGDRILFPSAVGEKIKPGETVTLMPPLIGG